MLLRVVGIYTALHFLIDFACATLLYHQIAPLIVSPIELFFGFFLYNFFAFAVQLPIGIIADSVNKNGLFAAAGCLLVLLAYFCMPFGIIACIIAGIGNACYHVGAGIDVLNLAKGKATLPGIFVSSGALGIFLGAQKFMNQSLVPLAFVIALIGGAFLCFALYRRFRTQMMNLVIREQHLSLIQIFMIVCLCLTVGLRSYTGFILGFEWKNGLLIGLVFTAGIIGGKMLGGILSDRFGMRQTAMVSLLLSAVLFTGAFQNNGFGIVCGTVAVLLFNMTMPITLTALTNLLPYRKGMAFGMLTFMLFLGSVPILCGFKVPFFTPVGLSVLVCLSAVVLYGGLVKVRQ